MNQTDLYEKQDPLTEKQKQFCYEYVKDLNGTRAYKEVYKQQDENSARASASRLLKKVNVKAFIKELTKTAIEEEAGESISSIQDVLMFLSEVMKAEVLEEQVFLNNEDVLRIEKRASIKDRLKAAEMLSKYYKLFTENQQELTIQPVYFIESDIQE